jgi:hypothetical protein
MATDKQILKKYRSASFENKYKERFTWKGLTVLPEYDHNSYSLKLERDPKTHKFLPELEPKDFLEIDTIINTISKDLAKADLMVRKVDNYSSGFSIAYRAKKSNYFKLFLGYWNYPSEWVVYLGRWGLWSNETKERGNPVPMDELFKTVLEDLS